MYVDPGNRASFSSIWRLLLEAFVCQLRLFILSSLFNAETFKLRECRYERQNRPGIPQAQSVAEAMEEFRSNGLKQQNAAKLL